MKRLYLIPAIFVCSPVTASDSFDDLFSADMPVVLTASRIQQSPLDSPAPITVIDRQTIEASGFTEIQDLMRLVPGFQVANWYNGSPVVANHGMGSGFPHNLLVMLDGQSIVDPIKGTVDWTDLPLRVQDIERIEVVRGPNQASYGAGAYNGVINIITRTPGEDIGNVASFSSGVHDFHDAYARIGRQSLSSDWRLSVSDRQLNAFEDKGTATEGHDKRSRRQTLMANVVRRLEGSQEIDFNLGLGMGGDDRGGNADPTDPHHDYSMQSQYLELAWHANYSAGSEVSLRYAHYGHQQDEAYAIATGLPAPYASAFNRFDADTTQDSIEFQKIETHSERLKSVWGGSASHDSVKSEHYFYGKGTVEGNSWQIFGNLDWKTAPDWLLHIGGMVEEHYNTGILFSPRIALNYSITPKQTLRASVGRGYRAPTLAESDAMEMYTLNGLPVQIGVASPYPVAPEKVNFGELGYVAAFDEIGLHVDSRLYVEHYGNYLNAFYCGMNGKPNACTFPLPAGYVAVPGYAYNAYVYANAGSIKVQGGELSLDWRQPMLGRFLLAYAITHVHAEDVRDPQTGDDLDQSAPRHSLSLLWSKVLPWRTTASAGYYHVGKMKWTGDGDIQPAYVSVDLRLAKSFGKPASRDEISITAQGITGNHAEFRDKSFPIRQAFVTLKLGF